MINIFVLSFIVLLPLSVSFVSAGCDYNITSVSQLNNIFDNDQTGWTAIPTLCFAAGSYTLTENLQITASQKWVGPQAGVDPTCGRLINPPCSRYTSASTFNSTVEAVFMLPGYQVYAITVPNLNFTIDGFAVNGDYSNLVNQVNGMAFSVTLLNIYGYEMVTSADYQTIDHCFFNWPNPGSFIVQSTVSTTITNSYFNKVGAFHANPGALTAIGNTFTFTDSVAYTYGPAHFENNAFYAILFTVISDSFGQTSFKNNTFFIIPGIYEPSVKSILNFDSNCFVASTPNKDILYFSKPFNTTTSLFTNNYFGNKYGPLITYDTPSFTQIGNKFGPEIEIVNQIDFNFAYSSKPLHFVAPNVCPRSPFSLTVKPDNIKLGETVNITFSFELDPLIASAGITPSMFDGITLQLLLYPTDINGQSSTYLTAFSGNNYQITWNPSTQSSFSVAYTFQPNDLIGFTNGVLSPPNYLVYGSLTQTSGSSALNSVYASQIYAPITITPKVPLECYNMSLSINKNVTAGPRKYNFQQLGCSSSNWKIISVNTTNLFSYNLQNLTITVGTNTSGVRLARYQVSFFNSGNSGPSNLVHNVVTKITIINHNPVINSANFTWTYPRTTQTFPNWNLLTNCSDQDGDNLAVVQIQRNRARTNTSVVQLDDLTLHFVPEKVVVSVSSTGDITFTSPSNSNPVTAGSPLTLFWKEDISFQFQITDGDVTKQYAWGIADINYVQL